MCEQCLLLQRYLAAVQILYTVWWWASWIHEIHFFAKLSASENNFKLRPQAFKRSPGLKNLMIPWLQVVLLWLHWNILGSMGSFSHFSLIHFHHSIEAQFILLCWPYEKILICLINIFALGFPRSEDSQKPTLCSLKLTAPDNQIHFGYWELLSGSQLFQFLSYGVIVLPLIYHCLSLEDYIIFKIPLKIQL